MKPKHIPALLSGKHVIEMTFYVTDSCNFACKHCFVIDELNKKMKHLTVDEIRSIGPSVAPLQRVSISGGEPFIRKDIADVFLAISETWDADIITTPSNGFYVKSIAETLRRFGEEGKNRLRVMLSLNTHIEADYLSFINVPAKQAFTRWKESLEAARAATKRYPNLSMGVLTSYNIWNQEIFEDLVDFVLNELKVEDFSFGLVRDGEKDGALNLERFKSIAKQYYEERNKDGAFLSAYREVLREYMISYYQQPRMMTPCVSGKMRITMAPNGDVYPCETLGYPAKGRDAWLIGNIRDYGYDMRALMGSERALALHKQIVDTQCHCQDGCDMSVSLMMNNKFRAQVAMRAASKIISRPAARSVSSKPAAEKASLDT
jgi:radical SAM protein with 4Fe4S-binding SPASM domain